jgi:hypothetical protein
MPEMSDYTTTNDYKYTTVLFWPNKSRTFILCSTRTVVVSTKVCSILLGIYKRRWMIGQYVNWQHTSREREGEMKFCNSLPISSRFLKIPQVSTNLIWSHLHMGNFPNDSVCYALNHRLMPVAPCFFPTCLFRYFRYFSSFLFAYHSL